MKYETMKEVIFLKGSERKILDTLESLENIDFIDLLDERRNTALHYAVSLQYEKVIQKYFDLLANTRLWEKKFTEKIANESIKYRIKLWINAQNDQGLTAIHYASLKGLIRVAEILEDAGARLDKTTSNGLNVFSLAVQQNRIESLIFFRGKTDINATDNNNCTVLHWACYKGYEAIVRYLLSQSQIQIDFQQIQGRTALHIAVIYGFEKIVKILLLNGANRLIKDKQNKIPKDYAEEQIGKEKIFKMLTQKQKVNCSKNSFSYAPTKKQGPAYFIVTFILLYSIIAQNFILNNQSLIKDSTANLMSQNSSFIFSPYVLGAEVLLTTIAFIIAFIIHCRKPIKDQINLNYLIENRADNQNLNQFCFQCYTVTSDGIEHCHLCQQCVPIKITHNNLLGRCIGSHNIKAYIFMLIFLAFALLFCLIKGIGLLNYSINQELKQERKVLAYFMIVVDLLCVVPLALCLYEVYKSLKIYCRLSEIVLIKELSETTFDSRSTLLADKISRIKTKNKLRTRANRRKAQNA